MRFLSMMLQCSAVVWSTVLWSGCFGEGRVDAGFSVSWTIEDTSGTSMSCEMLKTDRVVIDIADARGETHVYEVPCDVLPFRTKEWDIAEGEARVSASLQNEGGTAVAAVDAFSFHFVAGQSANVVPEIHFVVADDRLAELGPRMDLSLQLSNGNGTAVACDTIGTGFLSFTLHDASGSMIELGAVPCDTFMNFSTYMPTVPAPGKAELEIAFRNPSFVRVNTQTYETTLALGDVVLGPVTLFVQSNVQRGDAGITWQWTTAGDPLDATACADAGIDYGALYVWDEATETWWTDPALLTSSCAAYDHAGDDTIFGDEAYSGIFLNQFLPQGDYRLFLGLFRRGASNISMGADVLAAFDVATPNNSDGPSGTLSAETASGTNLLVSDLTATALPAGDLRIWLGWENEDTFVSCADSGVTEMGVYLESAFGPATSLRLSDAYPCEDSLLFNDLPRTTEPYTLAIYGLDENGRMLWYQRCEDLFPEVLPDTLSPVGYRCDVVRRGTP